MDIFIGGDATANTFAVNDSFNGGVFLMDPPIASDSLVLGDIFLGSSAQPVASIRGSLSEKPEKSLHKRLNVPPNPGERSSRLWPEY